MKTDAVLSECRKYRFALWRIWDKSKPNVMFICLNPSGADENNDDPTVRRCINYTQTWGYGGLCIGNLFAFRSTKRTELFSARDPIGKGNNEWLIKLAQESSLVVAAWGNYGAYLGRSKEVMRIIPNLHYLKMNKTGEPTHPLYLKKTLRPTPIKI